jgi:uncharacterized protein (DUF4415 family)
VTGASASDADRAPLELSPAEIATLPDNAIDTSDMPELDDAFWARARVVQPDRTRLVTLRIKQSVLDAFRRTNPKGYQTRMNAVLESYARSLDAKADKR